MPINCRDIEYSLSVGRDISNLPLCVNYIFSSGCCGENSLAKIRAGATKGADAETVTGGLDLAGRAGNRGNSGRTIP